MSNTKLKSPNKIIQIKKANLDYLTQSGEKYTCLLLILIYIKRKSITITNKKMKIMMTNSIMES